jgi:hypothetical protein
VEHHVAVAREPVQAAGGAPLAAGAALPGPRLLRGAEPQPAADQRRHRQAEQAHELASQVGLRQAARQLGLHRDALKAAFA